MAPPPLSRALMRQAVRYLQQALNEGRPLKGRFSAVRAAHRRFLQDHPDSTLVLSSFQHRLHQAARHGIKPKAPKNPKKFMPPAQTSKRRGIFAPQLGGTPLDAELVYLQDECARLAKELREAHRRRNEADRVRELIERIATAPVKLPAWINKPIARPRGKPDPEVPVTGWADWHLGEVSKADAVHGYHEYNMAIAEDRVHRLFDQTCYLAREQHQGLYPGIVVNLVGDFVSGGIHSRFVKDGDLDPVDASAQAVSLIVTGLTIMRDHFGRVYVPAVCARHERGKAKSKLMRPRNSFDWIIASMVAKHFADDERVYVDIRCSNDVLYRVYGLRFFLTHGDTLEVNTVDQALALISRREVKKSLPAWMLELEYDIHFMGHWHQECWLPEGIVSNTLKGFDEYARVQLRALPSRPSQPLCFVHPAYGITDRSPVYVMPPTAKAKELGRVR